MDEEISMPTTKAEIIRSCFAAYKTKDRKALEALFNEDFTFTSPYDDKIDKKAYFERCWPNSQHIKSQTLEKIFTQEQEGFVTYLCVTQDDKQFRNTEFFRFEADKVKSIDVYFGASYQHGAFVKQT
jgi:ketosteroid isomerase-like protein